MAAARIRLGIKPTLFAGAVVSAYAATIDWVAAGDPGNSAN
jgi:hypothetical protein